MRTITDGEMNTGYTDLEGRWTDGAPAYVFNPAMKTVNTGTVLYFSVKRYFFHSLSEMYEFYAIEFSLVRF